MEQELIDQFQAEVREAYRNKSFKTPQARWKHMLEIMKHHLNKEFKRQNEIN